MTKNGSDNDAQLRATINAAIRSNVAFYTVDARGLVGSAPVVAHASDWYFGYGVFLLACVVALTAWGFRTAIGGQKLWKGELLG